MRYFWETYNYAYATLNAEPLTSISEKICELCASAAANVDDLKRDGKHIQGAEVVVVTAVSPPIEKGRGVIVATNIKQNPGTSTSTTGEVKQIEPVANHRGYVGLWFIGGRWKVNGVTVEDLKVQP